MQAHLAPDIRWHAQEYRSAEHREYAYGEKRCMQLRQLHLIHVIHLLEKCEQKRRQSDTGG